MKKRDDRVSLQDILTCCHHIVKMMEGINRDAFIVNVEKHSAVIRQLEIIGEAAT